MPVVDAEDKLVGILTEADFMSAMNLDGRRLANALETHRAQAPRTQGDGDDRRRHHDASRRSRSARDDTLEAAVARMDKNKVKRLVVTGEDQRVHGIVSRADLVKIFAAKG